ncbi:hypothetical protein NFT50_004804 [Salmonella enterica]|nr:hypothetical protein [Salmonella enterica]EJH7880925.1 hypothetical protein [Salmonella enterica]EJI6713635.1 hypothetical protein [Salmonella enterica]
MKGDENIINSMIDNFVDNNHEDLSVVLLKIVALPEQGGMGYHIELFNPYVDMDG